MHMHLIFTWLLASIAATFHASALAQTFATPPPSQPGCRRSEAFDTSGDGTVLSLSRLQDEYKDDDYNGNVKRYACPPQSSQSSQSFSSAMISTSGFTTLTSTSTSASAPVASTSASSSVASTYTSLPGVWNGCTWTVDNRYRFNSHLQVANSSWSSRSFNNTNTNSMYFIKSDTDAGPGYFNSSQISIDSLGLLRLNQAAVPTNSATMDAQSAQIRTAWSDITYGSVRTVAKGTRNFGAVYGMFFYGNGFPFYEADIELVTRATNIVSFTNQKEGVDSPTNFTLPNGGLINGWHEYRIDWVPGSVGYYVDGVLRVNKTDLVPQGPGAWFWNAWSNGGTFSQGPARQDNTFFIQSIDMYVNRTGLICGN